MSVPTLLHEVVTGVGTDHSLVLVLVLSGLASLGILALAVAALIRRRSWSYLLVTLAIGMLGLRVTLGGLMLTGLIDLETHHLIEHGVDFLMAGLLLAAVYVARTTNRPSEKQDREQYEQR